jgi:hypothetical protein
VAGWFQQAGGLVDAQPFGNPGGQQASPASPAALFVEMAAPDRQTR